MDLEERLTLVPELVGGLRRLVLQRLHRVVDARLVLEEERPDDAGVDQDGAVGGRGRHAPHQEGTLWDTHTHTHMGYTTGGTHHHRKLLFMMYIY